jgi:hypothetical protein
MLPFSRSGRRSIASFPLVPLVLTVLTCLGQSRPRDMSVDVPFSFVVAGHALPPGKYIVTEIGETSLRIYSANQGVIFATHPVQGTPPESVSKMVFHRYGSVYFLSAIWTAGNSTGRQLFSSQAEKEISQRTDNKIAELQMVR